MPPTAPGPGKSDTPQRSRQVIAALSLALLAFWIIATSVAVEFLDHGIESAILGILFWGPAVFCSIVFAVASRRSLLTKFVVIALGLAAPLVSTLIGPLTQPIAASLTNSVNRAGENRDVKHLAFLQDRFSVPQPVVAVDYPYVITEGGFSLKLYGPSYPSPGRNAAMEYFETTLEGKMVTATFPPDFLDKYMADGRRGTTYKYRAGESKRFGDAPALIFLDGELINLEVAKRWGSERVLEIWTEKYEEALRDHPQ